MPNLGPATIYDLKEGAKKEETKFKITLLTH